MPPISLECQVLRTRYYLGQAMHSRPLRPVVFLTLAAFLLTAGPSNVLAVACRTFSPKHVFSTCPPCACGCPSCPCCQRNSDMGLDAFQCADTCGCCESPDESVSPDTSAFSTAARSQTPSCPLCPCGPASCWCGCCVQLICVFSAFTMGVTLTPALDDARPELSLLFPAPPPGDLFQPPRV
jgi:hypothetical protein